MSVQNYGPHVPGLMFFSIFCGTITADATKAIAFKAPWPLKLLGFSTFARASSGTNPTLTANLKEAGTTVLASPCAVVADTITEASISDDAIADEATLSVDWDIGGTDNPTFTDVTLTFACMRL